MTGREALAFVERHGVVLQAARGPVPSLAEAIAGGPIRGSWWGHPRGQAIFEAAEAVGESEDVLVCKLVDGKVTFVHRRLWPALVKLADRFGREALAKVWSEHTEKGTHQARRLPFPAWVPARVRAEADALGLAEAEALLARVLPGPAPSRGRKPAEIACVHARRPFALTADPRARAWRDVPAVRAERDRFGARVPGHRTEIRSRWTAESLYLLFACPYEELHLKPRPVTTRETDRLWDWDVAEAFLGAEGGEEGRYREFQVSPQGEWVDLAIDRTRTPPRHDRRWDSGFEVMARISEREKTWFGEMRIPLAAIDPRPPRPGQALRANFLRIQGPPARRVFLNWQVVNSETFHTPSAFGRLRLQA
jgi:hypothetical protein